MSFCRIWPPWISSCRSSAERFVDDDPVEVIAVDEALAKLETNDAQTSEIVKLRYFAGLSIDETARVLDLGPRTVDKKWRLARAWLFRELGDGKSTRD